MSANPNRFREYLLAQIGDCERGPDSPYMQGYEGAMRNALRSYDRLTRPELTIVAGKDRG